jgi:hypothetical protein
VGLSWLWWRGARRQTERALPDDQYVDGLLSRVRHGAIFVEKVFQPGMDLVVDAIVARDYPLTRVAGDERPKASCCRPVVSRSARGSAATRPQSPVWTAAVIRWAIRPRSHHHHHRSRLAMIHIRLRAAIAGAVRPQRAASTLRILQPMPSLFHHLLR